MRCLIMMLILSFFSSCSSVKSISYSSLTRGTRKEILINSKGIKQIDQKMGGDERVTTYLLKNEDWNLLVKSLSSVDLKEISTFESPSNKRQYDGAYASTITIKSKLGNTYEHGFDNYDPHEKLKPLMNKILDIIP